MLVDMPTKPNVWARQAEIRRLRDSENDSLDLVGAAPAGACNIPLAPERSRAGFTRLKGMPWESLRATRKQLDFLKFLGVDCSQMPNRGEATLMIAEALKRTKAASSE